MYFVLEKGNIATDFVYMMYALLVGNRVNFDCVKLPNSKKSFSETFTNNKEKFKAAPTKLDPIDNLVPTSDRPEAK